MIINRSIFVTIVPLVIMLASITRVTTKEIIASDPTPMIKSYKNYRLLVKVLTFML
jgi:hypothetical protein